MQIWVFQDCPPKVATPDFEVLLFSYEDIDLKIRNVLKKWTPYPL